MVLHILKSIFLIISLFTLNSCGVVVEADSNNNIILLIDDTFVPDTLSASAGEIIFIKNENGTPIHVLSQTAVDQFDDTGTFDSFVLDGEINSITVPATAAVGDTFIFYDDLMRDQLTTSSVTITVE